MRTPTILVKHLRVESVSDPTPDPYGQPGFSTLVAYVASGDDALIRELSRAAHEGASVVLRCATLEIEGHVGKAQFDAGKPADVIAIVVDDLRYFKPDHDVVVERRKLD